MMLRDIKVKRHSFLDNFTKTLCDVGKTFFAKSSSIDIPGFCSLLCVLKKCSKIQEWEPDLQYFSEALKTLSSQYELESLWETVEVNSPQLRLPTVCSWSQNMYVLTTTL